VSKRIYLGLDIAAGALRAAALRRGVKKRPLLIGARREKLAEGVVRFGLREPNILLPDQFVAAVRRVLTPLSGAGEDRLSVVLGAGTGLVMPMEVESAFKSRSEGEEMLRWQLKNRLPVEPEQVRLAYQVLETTDTGRCRLLVGVLAKSVLEQFEALLADSGYHSVVVDFHLLSVSNFYRPRFDFGADFLLLNIEGRDFGFQYFQRGVLRFCRVRQMERGTDRLVQELHRTRISCHGEFPGSARCGVFLHTTEPEAESLRETVASVFEREVVLPGLPREAAAPIYEGQYRELVAAIGAAERMM
jgi:type IV pilus assembly protein PilM